MKQHHKIYSTNMNIQNQKSILAVIKLILENINHVLQNYPEDDLGTSVLDDLLVSRQRIEQSIEVLENRVK